MALVDCLGFSALFLLSSFFFWHHIVMVHFIRNNWFFSSFTMLIIPLFELSTQQHFFFCGYFPTVSITITLFFFFTFLKIYNIYVFSLPPFLYRSVLCSDSFYLDQKSQLLQWFAFFSHLSSSSQNLLTWACGTTTSSLQFAWFFFCLLFGVHVNMLLKKWMLNSEKICPLCILQWKCNTSTLA